MMLFAYANCPAQPFEAFFRQHSYNMQKKRLKLN